jgi:hypothetical protein
MSFRARARPSSRYERALAWIIRFAVLAAALLTVAAAGAGEARAPLRIGAVTPELLDPGLSDHTIALMQAANLADVARVTVTWQRGQTAIDPGLLSDLRDGVEKARAAGIDVYLDVYPNGSSQAPNSVSDQVDFATWTVSVVSGIPGLGHLIVGNEPNLNLFWLPQFGSSGQDLAASGYEHLLARTYDAVKAVTPDVEVLGGALAHSGADRPGTRRDTHSPAQFILDLGRAYRASHRTRPIMDAFAYHPYMERADLPPTFQHPRSKTLTIADYGKLVSVLKRAFDGTPQKGSTLPLVYAEFGVESQVPPSLHSLYSGSEPPTNHPVTEAMQANYYAEAMHLAACQPTVRAFLVFRLIDSPFLSSFQSGVYYADRQTPKSSRDAVAAAAARYRFQTVSGCAELLAPIPIVDWKRRTIVCDVDCAYEERFVRLPGNTVAASIRGRGARATAGTVQHLGQPLNLLAGRYRVLLKVTAVPYRANSFAATSPTLTIR